MAIREIVQIGDPVLRKKTKKVDKITPLILQLLDDMAETMYAAPGVGLAAPQIGISKKIVVVDIGEGLLKLINPKILHAEGAEVGTEACLSVLGKVGDVERATDIVVKAMTPEGKFIKIEAVDFMARCLQHEIDHLDGILYVDKATDVRDATEEEFEEAEEGGHPDPEDAEDEYTVSEEAEENMAPETEETGETSEVEPSASA